MRNLIWVSIFTTSIALAQQPETREIPYIAKDPVQLMNKLGFPAEYSKPNELSIESKALLEKMVGIRDNEREMIARDSGYAATALVEQTRLRLALEAEKSNDRRALSRLTDAIEQNIALLRRDFELDDPKSREEFVKSISLEGKKPTFDLRQFVRSSRTHEYGVYNTELVWSYLSLRDVDPAAKKVEKKETRVAFPWNEQLRELFTDERKATLLAKVSVESALKSIEERLNKLTPAEKRVAYERWANEVVEAVPPEKRPHAMESQLSVATGNLRLRQLTAQERDWVQKIGFFKGTNAQYTLQVFDTLVLVERFRLSLKNSPKLANEQDLEQLSKWVESSLVNFKIRLGLEDANVRARFAGIIKLSGESRIPTFQKFMDIAAEPLAANSAEFAQSVLRLADVEPDELRKAMKPNAFTPALGDVSKLVKPDIQELLLEGTSATTALESLMTQVEQLAKK